MTQSKVAKNKTLVLTGVIDDASYSGLAVGSPVMFTGPYGVRENDAM
jgi:hypothetical protein